MECALLRLPLEVFDIIGDQLQTPELIRLAACSRGARELVLRESGDVARHAGVRVDLHDGNVERIHRRRRHSSPALGHLPRVRAALQQQRREGHVPPHRGIHQRREGVVILARVDLRAAVKEEPCHR